MADLVLTEGCEDDLTDLEREPRERLLSKLDDAAAWPDHHLKRLSNGAYAVRAGQYRVICDWHRDDGVVVGLAAGHRRNVYDRNL